MRHVYDHSALPTIYPRGTGHRSAFHFSKSNAHIREDCRRRTQVCGRSARRRRKAGRSKPIRYDTRLLGAIERRIVSHGAPPACPWRYPSADGRSISAWYSYGHPCFTWNTHHYDELPESEEWSPSERLPTKGRGTPRGRQSMANAGEQVAHEENCHVEPQPSSVCLLAVLLSDPSSGAKTLRRLCLLQPEASA